MQAHSNGPVLDDEILADSEVMEAIKSEGTVHRSYNIQNTDRASLGRVGGAIARLHGDSGFAGQVSIDLQASCPVCVSYNLIKAHSPPILGTGPYNTAKHPHPTIPKIREASG